MHLSHVSLPRMKVEFTSCAITCATTLLWKEKSSSRNPITVSRNPIVFPPADAFYVGYLMYFEGMWAT